MSTRFRCAYWALTLARLTAAASMALLERVGVERGEPLVRRGEVAENKQKQCRRCANKQTKRKMLFCHRVGIKITLKPF